MNLMGAAHARRATVWGAIAAGLLTAAACSSSSPRATATTAHASASSGPPQLVTTTAAPTSTTSTTSMPVTTTVVPVGGTTTSIPSTAPQQCSTTNGPADYDPQNGFYSTAPKTVDVVAGTLRYDVVQVLTGHAADVAYQQDVPGAMGGPPDDYWVRNVSPRIYEAPFAPDVVVFETGDPGNPQLQRDTLANFEARIRSHYDSSGVYAGNMYWVRLGGGQITELCEQWVP